MKYMGSKNRHAKELLPIILKHRAEGQWYVEPFSGGCNMIDKVSGLRLANDYNKYLIAFCKDLSNGILPPEDISEDEYKNIKQNKEAYSDSLLGYVGFQLTFGSVWFSGYRKDSVGVRDYSKEAFNNIIKQQPRLVGIKFESGSYLDMSIPKNSVIYCDPPYEGTSKYKEGERGFDHNIFWQWCRNMVSLGHQVFVSEYSAPDDFVEIWSKSVNNTLAKDTGSKQGVEKLFIHESQMWLLE